MAKKAAAARRGAAALAEGSNRRSRIPGFSLVLAAPPEFGELISHPSKTSPQDQQKTPSEGFFNILILLNKLALEMDRKAAPE
ncbi:MAG: hypothetical protein NTV97_28065 [Alphaproteobacteria bacterium]|nr:hypothetical protein [Alphaproteobacteria bacterium]